MYSLKIVSSSYLLPKFELFATNIIKKIEHKTFNDFNFNVDNNENSLIFYILFHDDLFDVTNKNGIDKKIEVIFNRIEFFLKKKVFFFFSDIEIINKNIFNNLKNFQENLNFIKKIEEKKKYLNNKYNNFFFLDLNYYLNKEGKIKSFDTRNWYMFKCHLSNFGIDLVYKSVNNACLKIINPAKKLLVLDCDNTLWGGVVGEVGAQNIVLGQDGIGKAYQDFQKKIKILKNKGLMLALCSKNIEEDVFEVFKKNNNMILNLDDVVSTKINWKEKYLNINEISSDLNIGLDSFVFWDDNPIERNKVKNNLKEVFVPNISENVTDWPSELINLNCFLKPVTTNEDKNKTIQYKNRSKFINDLKKFHNEEEKYLKSIKMNAKFKKINEKNILRSVQMCDKTNQFNFSTKRHNVNFFKKNFKSKKFIMKVVSLKDIYGDHGTVGLYILEFSSKKNVKIVTFLMSCRILGRKLEFIMIQDIIAQLKKRRINSLLAEYIPSKKNVMIKEFLSDCNFIYKSKNHYELKINKFRKNWKNIYERYE